MRRIKNWSKFNEKPFRVLDEEPKKGDYFIFGDDGQIRKCTNIAHYPSNPEYDRVNYTFRKSDCKKIIFDDTAKMEFDEEKFPTVKMTPPNVKKGDIVYVLSEYNLDKAEVLSISGKNVKVKFLINDSERSFPFDKVAEPDESIAVVWEQWKGANGRGGYRIERELYPNKRREAKKWPHQALVWEDHYGEESDHDDPRL